MRRLALAALGTAALTALAIPAVANAAPGSPHWPSHTVLLEPARLGIGNQVVDGATGTDFALASTNGVSFRLRRTVLASGRVRLGPRFPVQSVALGAGSVWVYGAQAVTRNALKFRLYQVNPASLAVIRTWVLSAAQRTSGFIGFSPGGGGDVLVGFLRKILTINAATGATVRTITVRSGLVVSDVGEKGRYLYAAANGPAGGSVLFEYDARTGRLLASNGQRPLLFSVGGAQLTAAPGGVWVSFRTGMLGQTVLLRQRGLRIVRLPGTGTRGYLFAWAMTATTEFASRSLFLAKLGGQIGCMDPGTGQIRARGSVPALANTGQLLGSAGGGRVLYGLSPQGVVAITPPSACR